MSLNDNLKNNITYHMSIQLNLGIEGNNRKIPLYSQVGASKVANPRVLLISLLF